MSDAELPKVYQITFTADELDWMRHSSSYVVAERYRNLTMLLATNDWINRLILKIGQDNMSAFIERLNTKIALALGTGLIQFEGGKIATHIKAEDVGK